MANQPAADSKAIYIRVHESIKQSIQDDVDRINADTPGANANITSWIKAAIDEKLKKINKKSSK